MGKFPQKKNSTSVKVGEVRNPYGRPRGTPDVRTKFKNLTEKLESLGYDPVQVCIDIANNPDVEVTVRERANSRLMERTVPILKSIEHTVSDETLDKLVDFRKEMLEIEKKYQKDF